MPSITEWITAIASLVVAVMAVLTLLGKCPVTFSKVRPQADDDPLHYRVKKLEEWGKMQGEKIEKLEQRLNGPLVLSGRLTEAAPPMTNRG